MARRPLLITDRAVPVGPAPPGAWRWEAAFVALLLTANLVGYLVLTNTQRLVEELLVAAVAGWLAHRSGLGLTDLGLGRAFVRRGLAWGLAIGGVIATGAVIGALIPLTRELLADDAIAREELLGALGVVLLRIPLGTALPEEVLFRGVAFAMLSRRLGANAGMWGSAALFGVWHVTVLLGIWQSLPMATLLPGPLGVVAGVLAVGLSTAAAGLGFVLLRRWSGSLVAPFLVHWAANGSMRLAAAAATSWR
jgi:membrane protease YdiL (CAAX protease family)